MHENEIGTIVVDSAITCVPASELTPVVFALVTAPSAIFTVVT